MQNVVWVGLGGFLGAVARYLLASYVVERYRGSFPLSTFVVNVAGCLVIGALLALAEDRDLLGGPARLFLFTGVLGSFTTFSTFGADGVALLRGGEIDTALFYLATSVVVGLAAVWTGRAAVGALLG